MLSDSELLAGQETLLDEYLNVKEEIATLQCEVKPLQQRYFRLQQDILLKHEEIEIKKAKRKMSTPAVMNATLTSHNYSSAIVQFQSESEDLSARIMKARSVFSNSSLNNLQSEIDDETQHVLSLQEDVDSTTNDINEMNEEINAFRLSKLYEDVQKQKEKIQGLKAQIDEAKQVHSALKNEYYLNSDNITENEESSIIDKLEWKLSNVRKFRYERCEYFIALRQKQMAELDEIRQAISESEQPVKVTPSVPTIPSLNIIQSIDYSILPQVFNE